MPSFAYRKPNSSIGFWMPHLPQVLVSESSIEHAFYRISREAQELAAAICL